MEHFLIKLLKAKQNIGVCFSQVQNKKFTGLIFDGYSAGFWCY